jgi:hypothetical protein
VANEVGVNNWDYAGYVNLTTSDSIVHGQVKQAGKFSFVRVYDSGHEVVRTPHPNTLLLSSVEIWYAREVPVA